MNAAQTHITVGTVTGPRSNYAQLAIIDLPVVCELQGIACGSPPTRPLPYSPPKQYFALHPLHNRDTAASATLSAKPPGGATSSRTDRAVAEDTDDDGDDDEDDESEAEAAPADAAACAPTPQGSELLREARGRFAFDLAQGIDQVGGRG